MQISFQVMHVQGSKCIQAWVLDTIWNRNCCKSVRCGDEAALPMISWILKAVQNSRNLYTCTPTNIERCLITPRLLNIFEPLGNQRWKRFTNSPITLHSIGSSNNERPTPNRTTQLLHQVGVGMFSMLGRFGLTNSHAKQSKGASQCTRHHKHTQYIHTTTYLRYFMETIVLS